MAIKFVPKTRNRRWHYALLVWFFASIAFGSPSFADAADPATGHDHAQMLSMHEAMSAGQQQTPDMPVRHDHGAMQCCMISCVATCGGVLQNGVFVNTRTVSVHLFSADEPLLRSLYLDSDPPVPKT